MLKKLLQSIIFVYKKGISPFLPPACRFYPTCSNYAYEAIEVYGPFRGLLLAVKRFLKCQPFHSGGYDPVVKERTGKRHRSAV